jgi:two-component system response regulator RegX3
MKSLIISSDPDLSDNLRFILSHAGYSVQVKRTVNDVLPSWLEYPFDLVLLSHRDMDALLSDLQALRSITEVPALALFEAPREIELVTLLEAGVDLVLSLPIGPKVLTLYCQTLLRRANRIPAHTLPILDLENISLDPTMRTVKVHDQEMKRLTQLEFRLLYILMTQRGHVIPSDVIVDRVWGYSEKGNKELIRGLVSRLRSKIEPDPSTPSFIHTIPGVGYLFEIEN